MCFSCHPHQVKQRAFDIKQALTLLYLLNDGGKIHNLLEAAQTFDFSQFQGSLDVEKAAVIGHSFGGAATIQVLCEDARFM